MVAAQQEQIEELLHWTRGSLVNTGKALYPDQFSIRPSPLHHELSDALVNSDRSTALAFPREFGKSTFVWEGVASWNILHQRYRYIMYIASTATIAEDALTNVKSAIESHPLLASIIQIVKSTKNQFFFKINGKSFFYACYGAGQQLRGKRFERFRPDLVIMDDLETTEQVRSEDQRKKLKDWFWADVIPLGKEARFFYVGTMLHEACLLAELIENPPKEHSTGKEWQTFRFGVVDDSTGEATWPEKYDDAWIEMTRKKYIMNGMLYRFNTEYMNLAVAREDRNFRPDQLRFYNPEQLKNARGGGMDLLTIVDPGLRPEGDHDPTVVWTSGMDSLGQLWILNVLRKRMAFHDILQAVVDEYREWNARRVLIEAVQGQVYLLQELEHGHNPERVVLPVEKIDSKQVQMGKVRIYQLEKLFHDRKILVPASAPWLTDYIDEMVTFPRGKNEDILDCNAYAFMNHVRPGKCDIDVQASLNRRSSTVIN